MSFSALSIGREGYFGSNSMKKAARSKGSLLCKTVLAARSGEPPKRTFLMKFARGGAKGGKNAPPCAEEELTL